MNSSNGERWRRFRLFRRKKKRSKDRSKKQKQQLHPTIFEDGPAPHHDPNITANTTVEEDDYLAQVYDDDDDDSILDSSIIGSNNNVQLITDDEDELFELSLRLEDEQRKVIAEQRRVVRACENTCASLLEILRVHKQSLATAQARLDKQRRDDPTLSTTSDPEALLPLEMALEEMYQEQYQRQKVILADARKRLQESIQAFQEDHADDGSVAPVTAANSNHHSLSRSNSHDSEDGDKEEKKGESSNPFNNRNNPFDSHDDDYGDNDAPFDTSGIVSVDDFVNHSQQFSQKLTGFLQQQNLMDWMQKDQLQDHMKTLQIQKEQTERAVECLQAKISENTSPKKSPKKTRTPIKMIRVPKKLNHAEDEDSDVEYC